MRKTITHELRLTDVDDLIAAFVEEVAPLVSGGVILAQFPPKLAFDEAVAERFFRVLRSTFSGSIACEPRHVTWFGEPADALFAQFGIARVAADPAIVPAAASPGGDRSFRYFRWHGTPRVYWSTYDEQRLSQFARLVHAATGPAWCIFDNTAHGGAAENALAFQTLLDLPRVEHSYGRGSDERSMYTMSFELNSAVRIRSTGQNGRVIGLTPDGVNVRLSLDKNVPTADWIHVPLDDLEEIEMQSEG